MDSLVVDQVYLFKVVNFLGYDNWVDLLILNIVGFDTILGMDSPYHVSLDCHAKNITLVMHDIPCLVWKGTISHTPKKVILFLKAKRMVEKVYLAYLEHIWHTSVDTPSFESILVESEFAEVFSVDLLIPPGCDINYGIDLDMSTQYISIPPYMIAP